MDRTPAHLTDMLGFAEELNALALVHDRQTFVNNRILCLAVEKLFINLGEAAARVGDCSQLHPQIPWRRIIGLRNILAHGYEQVAHEILYQTMVHELPALIQGLRQALMAYRLS